MKAAYKTLNPAVSYDAIVKRLSDGWTNEEAFGLHRKLYLNHTAKAVVVRGKAYHTVDEAYSELSPDAPINMIYHRIRQGLSAEEAFFPVSFIAEWMAEFEVDGRSSYTARELYALYKTFVKSIPGVRPVTFMLWGKGVKRIAFRAPRRCKLKYYRASTGPRYRVDSVQLVRVNL
jgi:hypothetical protein